MRMVDSVLSRRHGRSVLLRSLAPLLVSLAVLAGLCGGCGDDPEDPTFPVPPAPETYNWLFDIYGTSETNIYACGNFGAMWHYDGDSWTKVKSGSSRSIVTLWGPGGGDNTLYACGHGGYIGRNTGGGWSAMTSGTEANLYGLGKFGEDIYACGWGGALRRLSGSSWSGVGGTIVMRDPLTDEVEDELTFAEDIRSLVVVNQYGVAGAYLRKEPGTDEDGNILVGDDAFIVLIPDGMIMSEADEYPWLLSGLHESQDTGSEWVVAQSSSATVVGDNFLGSSEGWVWRLSYSAVEDEYGWIREWPQFEKEPGCGIKDMWMDPESNLYLVTDAGRVIMRPNDWDGVGEPPAIFDIVPPMSGIWGVSTDLFWTVGWCETIYEFRRDPGTGELVVTEFPLDYPDKDLKPAPTHDELDRPLR